MLVAKCADCKRKFTVPKVKQTKWGRIRVCPKCGSMDWEWLDSER